MNVEQFATELKVDPALLGDPSHGHWRIAPHGHGVTTRRYVPDTAVLETHYETSTGAVVLYDFMPLSDDDEHVDVVRIVRGSVSRMPLRDYGQGSGEICL